MTLQEKEQEVVAAFAGLRTPHDRLAAVVERGKKSSGLSTEEKTTERKVPGCLSNLWFVAQFKDGLCYFQADSDSAVVKGVAVLLCECYSGLAPSEVAGPAPDFLKDIGITQHLSSNRRNGLTRIREEMVDFARKHMPAQKS
jgi:cysteine desulfuration protein SufE